MRRIAPCLPAWFKRNIGSAQRSANDIAPQWRGADAVEQAGVRCQPNALCKWGVGGHFERTVPGVIPRLPPDADAACLIVQPHDKALAGDGVALLVSS